MEMMGSTEELKMDKMDEMDEMDFDALESQVSRIDEMEEIRVDAEAGLSDALDQMESLKNKLNNGEGEVLIDACKASVMNSITGQFGLASMFIECKDGGNVTTTRNFGKGVTANDEDQKRHESFKANNDGSRKWKDVRNEGGYDKPLPGKRKESFKSPVDVIDEYTGKTLPKDGRAHLDHIVSAKEIERKSQAHLHMTPEQRAKMATSDSNLAFTDGSANQSKGDKPMEEWLTAEDKKTGGTKAERFEIDEKRALEKDKTARKEIKKELNKEAAKKYTKELLKTGAKDAASMAAYSALGVVMREFTQATFDAIKEVFAKRGSQSFKEIFRTFKDRMKQVIDKLKAEWKDILKDSIEGGLTAFLSNMLVFVVNLFATTLKKVVHMIRAGFVSLVQAFKIMVNPPEGMSQEEARFQAAKIMMAGLIGAASLGLSAAVEKFLQAIPGLQPLMMFPIPSVGGEVRTVSDIVAVTLTSIMGGVLTTVVIHLMDKLRSKGKQDKLQIQLVYQSGVVVQYSNMLSWLSLSDAFKEFFQDAQEQLELVNTTHAEITQSSARVEVSASSYELALEKLKSRRT